MNPPASHENAEKTDISHEGAAPRAAVDAEIQPAYPDLAAVVEAWPILSYAVRADIIAAVRAARTRE